MTRYKVNSDAVQAAGLKLRGMASTDPATQIGTLMGGDVVESTGDLIYALPMVWLPVRVITSVSVSPGKHGFCALSYHNEQYLVELDEPAPESPTLPTTPLLQAVTRAARMMQIPTLLLKAFMAVEGANADHRDGLLQVIPSTRTGVIGRMTRQHKLAALNLGDDPELKDAELNARFGLAYAAKNMLVQALTGAQYIKEHLDQFQGYVALAGLAYNAGMGRALRVLKEFGSDPYITARQYNKRIGKEGEDVTVQPGIEQIDPATGAKWIRYPVLANATGQEIFQYLYLRQVPMRGPGLLDYIFKPQLLARYNLYENERAPGEDTLDDVLVVQRGQFSFMNGKGVMIFKTAPLSQRDPQWKEVPLGFDSTLTIGSDGCTLTCLTMVANGFGFQETPATLNARLKALGYGKGFLGARMVWAGLPAALPGIKLRTLGIYRSSPANMDIINAALDAGNPVVVELDRSPSQGFQNHWVVLFGRQDGDYLMHDPWTVPTEASASLLQRFGFAGAPTHVITYAVFYEGSNPQAPVLGDTLLSVIVKDTPEITAANGLALRDGPINGTVITRLKAGTQVVVRDALEEALNKVGQLGQWLSVTTLEGQHGYLAAWLVQMPAPAVKALLPTAKDGISDPALLDVVQPPLRRIPGLDVEVFTPDGTTHRPKPVPLRENPGRGKVVVELAPGAILTVVEPEDAARAKLGQSGQWIHVLDERDREGFVPAAQVRLIARKVDLAPREPDVNTELVPLMDKTAQPTDAAAKSIDLEHNVTLTKALYAQVVNRVDVVVAGGLALRAGPITGAVKTRLPVGTRLELLDVADNGSALIGRAGQWVRVRTPAGETGYVAAWYVAAAPDEKAPEPGQPDEPAPEPTAPPVPPAVVAQGVVITTADAPLFRRPDINSAVEWRVTQKTPLRVLEPEGWAQKLGQEDAFVRVQTYAFKEGYVQASLLAAPADVDRRPMAVDANLPRSLCAWLYGMHDPYDRKLFTGTGKTGWVLVTERVVGGAGNTSYEDWSLHGYGVIARLNNDYGGSGTIPTPDQYDTFAAQCAQWVKNSRGCRIWVIGNEMNNPRESPGDGHDPAKLITPELYARCFNKVRAAIKAVQPNAIVMPGALDCFQGPRMSCLEWFTRMLAEITDLDALALHCYTNGYEPQLVTDMTRFEDDPLRWQYFHFRSYTTFLDVVRAKWRGRPLYITETDPHGPQPWAGDRNGWVQAAYAEIQRWNMQPLAQQIHALILYRWSRDDIYSILDKPGVQQDFHTTIASTDYRWRLG